MSDIPVSPCHEFEDGYELQQKYNQVCSSSRGSFSPLSDMRQPILFNDVSLARCSSSMGLISIDEGSSDEEKHMERQQMFGGGICILIKFILKFLNIKSIISYELLVFRHYLY